MFEEGALELWTDSLAGATTVIEVAIHTLQIYRTRAASVVTRAEMVVDASGYD